MASRDTENSWWLRKIVWWPKSLTQMQGKHCNTFGWYYAFKTTFEQK